MPSGWLAVGAGLLTFLSPCVLPIVPSYLALVGGAEFTELEQGGQAVRVRLLLRALAFVAGFSVVFVAMGWSAGWIGAALHRHRLVWQRLGAVFVLALALVHLFPDRFGWLLADRRFHPKRAAGNLLGAFAAGLAFAAGWTPCIGPILGSILVLGSTEPSRSTALLGAYSAGVGVPFLAVALFVPAWRRVRGLARWARPASGALLVATAALLWLDAYSGFLSLVIQWTDFRGW